MIMFYRTKYYVLKKKGRKEQEERSSLDSCQLIKNNECSRGFNFLPSQQPAQSQQPARRGREQAENTLFISPARPVPPNNRTPASDKATLASLLSSISQGAKPVVGDSLGLSHTTAFPLVPDTVTCSPNSLMTNDANMECKVSLI